MPRNLLCAILLLILFGSLAVTPSPRLTATTSAPVPRVVLAEMFTATW
ncbi:MAG: hypothetical protein KKA73_09920 [Chloroflexi bacterium]|nr:hypothetical protein [Chloroflexota bacterium]MBU1747994.1 hypothetical protein [Chloroflexota bacterium]MBU1880060.1 hypothetical protein [Chloroflexota bacterium]